MLTAEELIALLGLEPLPREGGYYAETYRSATELPGREGKSLCTAIYYLLTPACASALHRLPSDELWHFYLGDPVAHLQLHPDGSGVVRHLGADLVSGQRPQLLVPAGVWQGARLLPGGRLALMGTTVSPGFDFADFEAGEAPELAVRYPAFAGAIRALAAPRG